jgi:hypothetical protein
MNTHYPYPIEGTEEYVEITGTCNNCQCSLGDVRAKEGNYESEVSFYDSQDEWTSVIFSNFEGKLDDGDIIFVTCGMCGHSQHEGPRSPVFEHDCDCCTYLGTVSIRNRGRKKIEYMDVDLWIHLKTFGSLAPSVIARWSSDGPDYMSGTMGTFASESLAMAECIAIKRDLISYDHLKKIAREHISRRSQLQEYSYGRDIRMSKLEQEMELIKEGDGLL